MKKSAFLLAVVAVAGLEAGSALAECDFNVTRANSFASRLAMTSTAT